MNVANKARLLLDASKAEELPDGNVMRLNSERFKCPEVRGLSEKA